jgi:methylated-DNA-[protein]-cysteine S-methyltransferase
VNTTTPTPTTPNNHRSNKIQSWSSGSAASLYTRIDTPIGELLLVGDGDALHGLHMLEGRRPPTISPVWKRSAVAFEAVEAQLREYFDGRREQFDVPLAMSGSPFQLRVWAALREIPYGQTASYGEIARRVGAPPAARAVGIANARNPIAVIVPCHRVIGANGRLVGYGGGLPRKRLLLDLERATYKDG